MLVRFNSWARETFERYLWRAENSQEDGDCGAGSKAFGEMLGDAERHAPITTSDVKM